MAISRQRLRFPLSQAIKDRTAANAGELAAGEDGKEINASAVTWMAILARQRDSRREQIRLETIACLNPVGIQVDEHKKAATRAALNVIQ